MSELKDITMIWEEQFDEMFVNSIGDIREYIIENSIVKSESNRSDTYIRSSDAIKKFIKYLLQQERKRVIKEVEEKVNNLPRINKKMPAGTENENGKEMWLFGQFRMRNTIGSYLIEQLQTIKKK